MDFHRADDTEAFRSHDDHPDTEAERRTARNVSEAGRVRDTTQSGACGLIGGPWLKADGSKDPRFYGCWSYINTRILDSWMVSSSFLFLSKTSPVRIADERDSS